MIIQDLKIPVDYDEEMLLAKISKETRIPRKKIRTYRILRRSLDARKKPQLYYVMKLAVNEGVSYEPAVSEKYRRKVPEEKKQRIFIAGSGPAGLFAALALTEAGVPVTVLERGHDVQKRTEDVEKFFESGILDPVSNVQFGEGGAGTFSDGKLNTRTTDPDGLNQKVLYEFYRAGAPEEILYDAKPHVGTDILKTVVRNLREKIILSGGEFRFSTLVSDLLITDGKLAGIYVENSDEPDLPKELIPASRLILACGHSARDTYEMLYGHGAVMEEKSFAVGVRIEHPQEMITRAQYGGTEGAPDAASYQLAAKTLTGRGVYSFCMCPGGYVVNASSEPECLAVNGMSYSGRSGKNANSGIVVQVSPEDYPGSGPLSGIAFQREMEARAYQAAGGRIPVQCYRDFREGRRTESLGEIAPDMKGQYGFANLREVLPEAVSEAILEAMPEFGRKIKGFDRPDAVMSAVESRTSSPVRILRDEGGESSIRGLYPSGEGAGYAGGIVSSAIDGIKTASHVIDSLLCGSVCVSDGSQAATY